MHDGVDQLHRVAKTQPTLFDQLAQGHGDALSRNHSMAQHLLDKMQRDSDFAAFLRELSDSALGSSSFHDSS